MSDLKEHIEDLGDQMTKVAWIANHCQDNGLKTILDDIWEGLQRVYGFLDYHADEGMLRLHMGGEDGNSQN